MKLENLIVKEYKEQIKNALEKINISKTQLVEYSSRDFSEYTHRMMKSLMDEIGESAGSVKILTNLVNGITQ